MDFLVIKNVKMFVGRFCLALVAPTFCRYDCFVVVSYRHSLRRNRFNLSPLVCQTDLFPSQRLWWCLSFLFRCAQCEKSFSEPKLLIVHMKAHSAKSGAISSNKCVDCEETFPTAQLLKTHILDSHEKYLPFRCPVCRKDFREVRFWWSIQRHLSVQLSRGRHLASPSSRDVTNVLLARLKQVKSVNVSSAVCFIHRSTNWKLTEKSTLVKHRTNVGSATRRFVMWTIWTNMLPLTPQRNCTSANCVRSTLPSGMKSWSKMKNQN